MSGLSVGMNRNTFLRLAGSTALSAVFINSDVLGQNRGTDEVPNVVLIVSDDQPYNLLGVVNKEVKTPNLDRLAQTGVHFAHAYVTTSLCTPSRVSLLTGLHSREHGIWTNEGPHAPVNRSLVPCLKSAGYTTAFIGNFWHLGRYFKPADFGFDWERSFIARKTPKRAPGQTSGPVYRPYGNDVEPITADLPVDRMFTDTALSYIEKNKEKKFFLMLCYISPHEPYIMPEKYRRMYNPQDISLPSNYRPKPAGSEAVPLGEEEAKKLRANHFGMTSYLDEQVGRIMETVDRLGISHRTMIVFTSDNGYMLGSQGYVAKQVLYEEAIRVPLIFNLPSRFKPRVVDELVYVMDILPTLMELNSVPVPEYVSARSLLPLLEGRDVTVHDRIFSETGPAGSIAVRTKEWKWIFDPHVGDQLYDIAKDPYETRNLITDPQYGDILNELKNHVR